MKIEDGSAFRPRVIVVATLYLALAALVFFFAFFNLDGRLFWGDEGETAVLARNILKFGVPKVDDGVYHVALHGDAFDTRSGVWTWSPWLPEYITAASFAVFGQTTWAGRAPFALIGWLSVILLGFTAWKIYQRHRIALASMFLLGTSQVFLLHIRQCRYYSITVLAEILLVFGIYQIIAKNRGGPWLVLAGLTVQFYCNYTIAFANVPVLLILAWNLFRENRRSALPLITSLGIWVLISVPWLLYAEIWREGSIEGRERPLDMLHFYAWQFHFHFFPWIVVLLPIGGLLHQRFSRSANYPGNENLRYSHAALRVEKYLILLVILFVPALLVMPNAFSRYLLPISPVMCLLVAAWLFRYIKWTAVVILLLIVQCVSNVMAVATNPFKRQLPLRSPLADVVFSNLLPYEDRLSDLVKFFKENARPGDVVVSWDPEFPLAFYTQLTVVNAWYPLPPAHQLPRWILPRSATGDVDEKPFEMPDALKPYYEKITLNVHNSFQVDNIPEPEAFQLETSKSFAPFIIYKLKDHAPVPPEKSLPGLFQDFLVPYFGHGTN